MGQTSNAVPVIETVTGGVNEARFLTHMGTLFSTSTVVIAELMQNARRAGATRVNFDFQGEEVLTVTDNGRGIEDFAKLVVVAESGWSADVMENDDPFGIGFASAVFAAQTIRVESRGRAIELAAQDLIEKRPIAITTGDFIGGTRITLIGLKPAAHTLAAAIVRYARGFPIEVWRDGAMEDRPEAQALLPGEQTELGWLFIPGIHAEGELKVETRGMCYCQGLPVNAGHFTRTFDPLPRATPILHIDHRKYRPRVPDRDTLIDADEAANKIEQLVLACWMGYLERMKGEMDPRAFAEKFWRIARGLRRLDLMCDVDYLPPEALSQSKEYPIIAVDGSTYTQCRTGIARRQVELKEVTLCSPEIDELDGQDGFAFARTMFARAKGWIFVEPLPPGHWANQHVVDLSAARCSIAGKVAATGDFSGGYTEGVVKLVDGLHVTLDGDAAPIDEPLMLGIDAWGATYMVPRGTKHPACVLNQAATYIDGDDHYDASTYGQDSVDFNNLVAVLEGESPARTLLKCIGDGGAADRPNLKRRCFLVETDAEGRPGVLEIPDVREVLRAAREVVQQHNLLSTATDDERRATVQRHLDWWNSKARHLFEALELPPEAGIRAALP